MSINTSSNMRYITSAKRVFEIEARAVAALADRINNDFCHAVERILSSSGRTIICGMGKSGIIGKKISATLASTGTPSFFMHPGEAYHGDLGMATPHDIFILISYSGETDEVIKILPFLKDSGNFLIAITGNPASTLALAADCQLHVGVSQEACPLHLAPTSSTTATLAMGDALAIVLMEARNFKVENFARFHPGGTLGRKLLNKVEHEMIKDDLPLIKADEKIMGIIGCISQSNLGLAIVQTGANEYAIITDGDVRRALEIHRETIFERSAEDFMTRNPIKVLPSTRVEDAITLMNRRKISSLLVCNEQGILQGVFKK